MNNTVRNNTIHSASFLTCFLRASILWHQLALFLSLLPLCKPFALSGLSLCSHIYASVPSPHHMKDPAKDQPKTRFLPGFFTDCSVIILASGP